MKLLRGRGKWILILLLIAMVGLPPLAVVLGLAVVVPVRQETTGLSEPTIQLVGRTASAVQTPDATPSGVSVSPSTAGAPSANATQLTASSSGSAQADLLSPSNWPAWLFVLASAAGLVVLIGSAVVALIPKKWKTGNLRTKGAHMDGQTGGKGARAKYVLLALLFWFALSAFLILDFVFTVSLHLQFVLVYAAFWALVGALVLWTNSLREKLIVLVLFVLVLFSVRLVDWHSRKAFLKDFYSIKEGMTPVQVEQTMRDYMKGGGVPLGSPRTELDEQQEIVAGTLSYRHTDEGWGNSDWGVVTFENGRVIRTEFLPD